ncbi:MAG: hypothetical protein VKL39_24735 [Leptolyngbyaceae bacterium]|nr:hypothetical protein [Leptolyngbyaceae bacterium]
MRKEKKTVYTLCVDNYAPEITEITFPYMKAWADKIGADFYVIEDRKFPDAPPVYEKFQIYELSKEHKNDWNIFVDADALIHPDFFDVTTVLDKDMTCSNGTDFVPHRFRPNEYFKRDRRYIGKGNWLAFFSDWCRDYYMPLDIPFDEAIENIFPTVDETNFGITPCHLIDDYTVSRNIARYGLKHTIIPELSAKLPHIQQNLLAHQYLMPIEEKVSYLNKMLTQWKIQ